MPTRIAIEQIVGPDAFELLVAWRGGRRLHIPRREDNLGRLAVIIGEQAALRLVEEAAGCQVDLPKGSGRWVATARVERLARQGMNAAQIAAELRCTDRTVRNHLRKMRAAA